MSTEKSRIEHHISPQQPYPQSVAHLQEKNYFSEHSFLFCTFSLNMHVQIPRVSNHLLCTSGAHAYSKGQVSRQDDETLAGLRAKSNNRVPSYPSNGTCVLCLFEDGRRRQMCNRCWVLHLRTAGYSRESGKQFPQSETFPPHLVDLKNVHHANEETQITLGYFTCGRWFEHSHWFSTRHRFRIGAGHSSSAHSIEQGAG